MKRIGTVLIALLLTGCTAVSPQESAAPSPSIKTETPVPTATASVQPAQANAVAALLPAQTGFLWQYFGFAEYAETLTLQSVGQAGNATLYRTTGKVEDMSGHDDPSGAFAVSVVYAVEPGVLRQRLTGSKAMDSVAPDLELIRTPLEKGTQWEQSVSINGKTVTLVCSIDSVKTVEGHKVYSVSYRQKGGSYYELRDITEGFGVTAFQRLYEYEGGSDLIGYWLNAQEPQANKDFYKAWLPPLGKQFTYFGLAEYGHKGALTLVSNNQKEERYTYNGIYADGRGDESKFVVDYRVDLVRGTVTEQVISNERGAAEVNSKLHNLVILKFPLAAGSLWSHKAKLNGKEVTVQAEVEQYDADNGIVKVRYTAMGAAGYYNNTYIEERTFQKGYGMTSFSNLLPGDIGIHSADAKDAAKLQDAIQQHSFGYTMNKSAG